MDVRDAQRRFFEVVEATEPSADHPRNEDASFADPERGLIALSDGAGGHAGGEVASRAGMAMAENPYQPLSLVAEVGEDDAAIQERLAFEAMVKEDQDRLKQIEAQLSAEEARDGAVSVETANAYMDTIFRLSAASVEASSKTFAAMARREGKPIKAGKEPIATLMIARVFETAAGKKALVRSVGDSAAFVRRANGKVARVEIEEDSSLQKWVKDGEISQEDADRISQAKNCASFSGTARIYCTMYFGKNPAVRYRYSSGVTQMAGKMPVRELNVHAASVDVGEQDELFFTSDGVHDNLTNDEIAEVMGGPEPFEERAKRLVRASVDRSRETKEENFRPKPDDITIVALRAPESKREAAESGPFAPEREYRSERDLTAEYDRQKQLGEFLDYVVHDTQFGGKGSESYSEYADDLLKTELGEERFRGLSTEDKLDQLRLLVPEVERRAQKIRLELLQREISEFDARFPMQYKTGDKVRVPRGDDNDIDPATGRQREEAGCTIVAVNAEDGTYVVTVTGADGMPHRKTLFRERIEIIQGDVVLPRETFSVPRSGKTEPEPGWRYRGPKPQNQDVAVMTREVPEGTFGKEIPMSSLRQQMREHRADLGEQLARRGELEKVEAAIRGASGAKKKIERDISERKQAEAQAVIEQARRAAPDYWLTPAGQDEAKRFVEAKRNQIDTLRRRYPGQPDAEAMIARLEAETVEPRYWLKRREVESRRAPALFEWMLKMSLSERQIQIGEGDKGLLEGYDGISDTYTVRDAAGKRRTMYREQLDFLSADLAPLRSGMKFIRTYNGVPRLYEIMRIPPDKHATIAMVTEHPGMDAMHPMPASTDEIRQNLRSELRDGWQARYELAKLEKQRRRTNK